MSLHSVDNEGSLRVSLRESRMVLERLMQVTRVEPGLVPTLRDCALYSAALGLSGYPALLGHLETLRGAQPGALRLLGEDDAAAVVDGGGQHAWVVAPVLVDLCVDRHRRGLPAVAVVRNVADCDELAIVAALAEAHGLSAAVAATGHDGAPALRVTVEARPADARTTLDAIRADGIPVPASLWWRLFHLANEALAPDSYASRRHAGAIMVTADGRVVGRQDEDDTDLSLLRGDASAA
ncbi:hypothetical protein [Azospirillum rugosum]|uniref:Uncharacterized protein n=1 Tax=Azospirillum rugosum TaxID=416170 RepID=A0ABS4SUJ7_9PROT|nr:hypothetical protein [Azospirillum rugosum]MBP2296229.1 hypothetical protein [Azospirillum rugosum]MDQ0527086.1 hypothetical protein [Azospirillum rugosum]